LSLNKRLTPYIDYTALKKNSGQQKLLHHILEEIQPFSFMENIINTTSTIKEGKYSSTLKISYLQSNQNWCPAA